jgi:hypothetical protein
MMGCFVIGSFFIIVVIFLIVVVLVVKCAILLNFVFSFVVLVPGHQFKGKGNQMWHKTL